MAEREPKASEPETEAAMGELPGAAAAEAVSERAVPTIQAGGDLSVARSFALAMVAGANAVLERSGASAIIAGRNVKASSSAATVMIAGGDARLRRSGACLAIVGGGARIKGGFVGVLLTGKADLSDGARVLLGAPQAAALGAAFAVTLMLAAYLMLRGGKCAVAKRLQLPRLCVPRR
jgi:hypothetical protein